MLRNRLVHAMAVMVTAATMIAFYQAPASAGGGGGGFGSVLCGQGYTASCNVTASSPGSSSSSTTSSTTAGNSATSGNSTSATSSAPVTSSTAPLAGSGSGGGSSAAGGCNGTVNKTFGCIPPGCSISVQTLFCPIGTAAKGKPAAGARRRALPSPAALAAMARGQLLLPGPQIMSSPAQTNLQLTRLPTWLWISPAGWGTRSRTASVPGESVTATAAPTSVTWRPGDGSTVVCKGPGTSYTSTYDPASPSPTCGHTYTTSSAGQPHGQYTATATIEWVISWHGTGGTGGTLPPLYTTATAHFEVAESQALDTRYGGS